MNKTGFVSRNAIRITCSVHQRFSNEVNRQLMESGIGPALVENGRTVRQFVRTRPFRLPGTVTSLEDSPVDLYRLVVPESKSDWVISALADAAKLDIPGHGTIFSQKITEYGPEDLHCGCSPADDPAVQRQNSRNSGRTLLKDLSLLTFILSMPGSGENLSRVALELGTCVPVVTLGIGTGMRDRLGLLRITIPPEKEIVHLLVPSHDVDSIIRLMIEEVRLNLPGRGFVYSTPVESGILDTRLRLGKQEHAASIEQIIAAIDELKAGTSWRKRFLGIDEEKAIRFSRNNREITVICPEGLSGNFVGASVEAGAAGATVARVKRICSDEAGGGTAAREQITINVPSKISDRVVKALLENGNTGEDNSHRIQIIDSPTVFTYSK